MALRTFAARAAGGSRRLLNGQLSTPGTAGQRRLLNVHEYVAMKLMNEHNIGTPASAVASTPEEAKKLFLEMVDCDSQKDVVIKAQVLSGGRGLGTFKNGFRGGVHMCNRVEQAEDFAAKMLGQRLVTKQTGAAGLPCDKVLLMERMYMRREMYLSIMMDRATHGPIVVACASGGTSIEDLAETNPELILKMPIDIMEGMTDEQAGEIAEFLNIQPGSKAYQSGKTLLLNMYDMFIKRDCTLVEINPLAETPDGRVLACDAKLNFDDNAEWRQKEVFKYRDYSQEDPREVEAAKYNLNYVGLTGNIGCMVNGAGLAMSTMDIIKLQGGDPANFLDVGGGASEDQVTKAFELLNADHNVKAIFVNIFGGIMRCDIIAQGVIGAAHNVGLKKPLVIRLQGTNADMANGMISESDVKMIVDSDLEQAAVKAVAIAEIFQQAEKVGVEVALAG